MKQVLSITEAGVMGLHAMAILAFKEDQWRSTRKMAAALKVSEHHLSKVLQGLRRQGLIESVRGPRGGYTLAKGSDRISLLDIYEATEGQFPGHGCLLGKRVCAGKKCLLGDYPGIVNDQFRDYLAKTKLSEMKDLYQTGSGGRK